VLFWGHRVDLQPGHETRAERESGSGGATVRAARRSGRYSSHVSAESRSSSTVFDRQEHRSIWPASAATGAALRQQHLHQQFSIISSSIRPGQIQPKVAQIRVHNNLPTRH